MPVVPSKRTRALSVEDAGPVTSPVPAPIAVRKPAASKADTVLSALNRGKVIELGFARVKRLPPSVVAPKLLRAEEAVVAPVPPLARARVPASVIVPVEVIGPPEVVRPVVPPETATLVTEPGPGAPVGPVGITKSKIAAEVVPLLVTEAGEPDGPVEVVPTVIVAAVPAAPVRPVGP